MKTVFKTAHKMQGLIKAAANLFGRKLHVFTHSARGQSMVEFVIVFAAFIALVLALGALWHLCESGKLVEHATSSASHHLKLSDLGGWGDVLSY